MDDFSTAFMQQTTNSAPSSNLRSCKREDLAVLQAHPNIQVDKVSRPFTMLDYIICHGRLRESRARMFARQIATALAFCHKHNIVHRDVTFDNILVSRDQVKLTNFDLSTTFDPFGRLTLACGTSYFAPPEMLCGKGYVGPEVDVWEFGAVLYTMVCGKVPFDGTTAEMVRVRVKQGDVQKYPFLLSANCKDLLSKMLATDPASRASLTEVLSHPWMTKE